jgi:hypothetical protein
MSLTSRRELFLLMNKFSDDESGLMSPRALEQFMHVEQQELEWDTAACARIISYYEPNAAASDKVREPSDCGVLCSQLLTNNHHHCTTPQLRNSTPNSESDDPGRVCAVPWCDRGAV